jgi:hypothetical protein
VLLARLREVDLELHSLLAPAAEPAPEVAGRAEAEAAGLKSLQSPAAARGGASGAEVAGLLEDGPGTLEAELAAGEGELGLGGGRPDLAVTGWS